MLLKPINEEKIDLIAQACKEWNRLLYLGSRRSQWAKNIWGFRRQRQSVLSRTPYMIYHKLARDAVTRGLSGKYPYTPDRAFFVPQVILRKEGSVLWIRLYPKCELGFTWDGDVPVLAKIYKKAGRWYMDGGKE